MQIPEPQFVVFYNGNATLPEKFEMKLSDLYMRKTDKPNLEDFRREKELAGY